jgi:hypothetical protein
VSEPRLSPEYVREEFPEIVKIEAWTRCGGRCEGCGKDLSEIPCVYDHKWPTRRGGPPTLDNCQVLCDDGPTSCNSKKTHGEDLPGIAAFKRYTKNTRLPLDIGRPEKKPGSIQSRGFQGGPSRPFPSRQFPKRE